MALLDLANLLLLALSPLAVWKLWRLDLVRPGSLSRHSARQLGQSPWPIWWVGTLLILFAQGIGATLGFASAPGVWGPVAAAVGAGILGLGVSIWLAMLVAHTPWGAKAGLSLSVTTRDLVRGAFLFVLVLPVMSVVMTASVFIAGLISQEPIDPIAHETLKVISERPLSGQSLALIFAAVVLAPVVEEIMFRGFLQSGFLRLFRRGWLSVMAASVIFASVHVGAVGEARHALPPLFAFGVCLGVAYERTGRLWVPITMHAMFNAWNVAMTVATSG